MRLWIWGAGVLISMVNYTVRAFGVCVCGCGHAHGSGPRQGVGLGMWPGQLFGVASILFISVCGGGV